MKIGILGAGQLAGMLATAAKNLNIELLCVDNKIESKAQASEQFYQVDLHNADSVAQILKDVDCITYETENLPIETVKSLNKTFRISPNIEALSLFQDRFLEKSFLTSQGIPVVNHFNLSSWLVLKKAVDIFSYPFVIKTRCNGYDGKGQEIIHDIEELSVVWKRLSSIPTIAEQYIDFDFEVSIIAVRGKNKEILFYPMTLNHHKNGILRTSQAPFIDDSLEAQAKQYATLIMEKLDYIGVMTIEFFSVNNQLIVNEIAPRVHNSGHWTIEGAKTSQFENHLRAIAGLPLGSTAPLGHALMFNIIGNEPNKETLSTIPDVHFHWYGKEIKQGRKLGHLTLIADTPEHMENQAVRLRDLMMID